MKGQAMGEMMVPIMGRNRKARLEKGKAKPNAKAPLGQGGRFAALQAALSERPGVKDPAALAAAIGAKRYGKKKMQQMALAAAGRRG